MRAKMQFLIAVWAVAGIIGLSFITEVAAGKRLMPGDIKKPKYLLFVNGGYLNPGQRVLLPQSPWGDGYAVRSSTGGLTIITEAAPPALPAGKWITMKRRKGMSGWRMLQYAEDFGRRTIFNDTER